MVWGRGRVALAAGLIAGLALCPPVASAEPRIERTQLPAAVGDPSQAVPYGRSQLLLLEPWNDAIVRVNADGSLDRGFGTGGRLELPFADLAVDREGRILLAAGGRDSIPGDRDAIVTRLLADGSPDPSFGDRGVASVDLGGAYDAAAAVAVAADGRVVLGGTKQAIPDNRGLSDAGPAMARLLPDGMIDRSFGNLGVKLLPGGWEGGVSDILPLPGGGVVAEGEGYVGISIWKLTPSGSMAPRFKGRGAIELIGRGRIDRFDYREELFWADQAQVTRKGGIFVLATGERFFPRRGRGYQAVLLRLKPSGRVDHSFAAMGWGIASFGASTHARSLALLPGGVTLVAADVDRRRVGSDVGLVAFDRGGGLERDFGRRGKLTVDLGGVDSALDVVRQAGRAVVLAGSLGRGFWLLRLPPIG
jgi:uncharacterized delta-60 repeat protein